MGKQIIFQRETLKTKQYNILDFNCVIILCKSITERPLHPSGLVFLSEVNHMSPLALFTEDWRQNTCLLGDRTVITDLMCGQSQDLDWSVIFGTKLNRKLNRKLNWKLNWTELDGFWNALVSVAQPYRGPAGGPRVWTFLFGRVVPTHIINEKRAGEDRQFIYINFKIPRCIICNYWIVRDKIIITV